MKRTTAKKINVEERVKLEKQVIEILDDTLRTFYEGGCDDVRQIRKSDFNYPARCIVERMIQEMKTKT